MKFFTVPSNYALPRIVTQVVLFAGPHLNQRLNMGTAKKFLFKVQVEFYQHFLGEFEG